MTVRATNVPRLYIDCKLEHGARVSVAEAQAHYLRNVLRLTSGDGVLLFNGRDGEWSAAIAGAGKRHLDLEVGPQTRTQTAGPDIHYLFAPLKRTRLDYVVQKAVELGVARLIPVLTSRTVAERLNAERLYANVIEAAEQCGVLRIPEIAPLLNLDAALDGWPAARQLVFCDEEAPIADPLVALGGIGRGAPVAVLIGPEGGFTPAERAMLIAKPFAVRISLGPRIMRADTAAVAVLALVNAVAGDWAPTAT
jgi:16S rRNA (uracil1498-N3)-methyltransferase